MSSIIRYGAYGANNQGTIFINQGVNTSPDFEQILVQEVPNL